MTANLLRHKFQIDDQWIHALEMDTVHQIHGARVTLMDANHCPGSCLILFELANGESYLHTGDFRFTRRMLQNNALKPYLPVYLSSVSTVASTTASTAALALSEAESKRLTAVYLDTTYCHPSHLFPHQDDAIDTIVEMVRRKRNDENGRTLFLIGTYLIGKERILERVAHVCGIKIFASYPKWKVLQLLQLPYFDKVFTTDVNGSDVHVVNMFDCTWKKLWELHRTFGDRYDEIVAIKPTGWSFSGGGSAGSQHNSPDRTGGIDDSQQMIDLDGDNEKPAVTYTVNVTRRGKLTLCQVPYSEHSAFYELREFIESISPQRIIPTVYSNEAQKNSMLHFLSDTDFLFDWRSVNNKLVVPDHFYEPYVPRSKKVAKAPKKSEAKRPSTSILSFFKNMFSKPVEEKSEEKSSSKLSSVCSRESVEMKQSVTLRTGETKFESQMTEQSLSFHDDSQDHNLPFSSPQDSSVIDLDEVDMGLQYHIMSSIERERSTLLQEQKSPPLSLKTPVKRHKSLGRSIIDNNSNRGSGSGTKRRRANSMGSSKRQKSVERRSMSILSFMRKSSTSAPISSPQASTNEYFIIDDDDDSLE